jgi:hypothetical protein
MSSTCVGVSDVCRSDAQTLLLWLLVPAKDEEVEQFAVAFAVKRYVERNDLHSALERGPLGDLDCDRVTLPAPGADDSFPGH